MPSFKSILTVCSFWCATTAAWAQSDHTAPLLPTQAQLSRYGLVRQWWGTATINPHRDKVTYLSLDDTQLYVQTSAGTMTCFDAETGRRKWATRIGLPDAPQFPPTVSDDLLLVLTGAELHAIHRESGDQIWNLDLPSSPGASPVADEEAIYVAMIDGSLMSFDLKKIRENALEGRLPQWSYQTVRWKYQTNKPLAVPAVVAAPYVSFASTNGTMYTVDRRLRNLQYTFDASQPVSSELTTHHGKLFIPSGDARLYAIEQSTGQIHWQYIMGAKIVDPPRVVENDLFVVPIRSGMHCLTADQGDFRWRNDLVTEFIGASPNTVFARDEQRNILMLNRADGSLRSVLPLDRFSVHYENEQTDRIYIATPSGVILCLREFSRPSPLYFKYPERQPIMPKFAPENAPEEEAEMSEPETTEPESTEPEATEPEM